MLNQYEIYEDRSRKKYKQLFLDHINPTKVYWPPLESPYDCLFQLNDIIYMVELKERNDKYAYYDDMLLQYDKYKSLINKKAEYIKRTKLPIKIVYVHTFKQINNLRSTILPENYKRTNFIPESHQKSHVENNGYVTKYVKYLTENIKKNY